MCLNAHIRFKCKAKVNLRITNPFLIRFLPEIQDYGNRKELLMLPISHSPKGNQLLAALSDSDYERLLPDLELMKLPLGWAAYESGSKQSNVYFPTDSVISLIYVIANGGLTEVAVTGNEGMIGIPLLMGADATTGRAVVRSPGHAFRLKYNVLKARFEAGGPLQDLLLRYTQSLMTQIAQTAVCNRYHTVEQRLCRWLLMSLDRLSADQLSTTQEQIANMLGVRREGVTEAAKRLQGQGLIRYSRGHIAVVDRPRLEEWACECYAVVKLETDRLMLSKRPASPRSRRLPLPSRDTKPHMFDIAQPRDKDPIMIPRDRPKHFSN